MVRVIIERRVKQGSEVEFSKSTVELRTAAMKQPGYVTSETWVGNDDHLLSIVISTWLSADLWQAWENSAERQAINQRLEPLLAVGTKTTLLRHPGEVEVLMGYTAPQLVK